MCGLYVNIRKSSSVVVLAISYDRTNYFRVSGRSGLLLDAEPGLQRTSSFLKTKRSLHTWKIRFPST